MNYYFIIKTAVRLLVSVVIGSLIGIEREKQWQYRETPILPQTKACLIYFKKITNPNVSPIGKRFGPRCFGAGNRNLNASCKRVCNSERFFAFFFSSSLFSLPEKLLAGSAPLPNENRPRRFRGRGGFGAPEDSIIELYNYVYISEIIPSISSLWQRL